ncbi:hypothetical protein D3C80_1699350 [compost metagenome]
MNLEDHGIGLGRIIPRRQRHPGIDDPPVSTAAHRQRLDARHLARRQKIPVEEGQPTPLLAWLENSDVRRTIRRPLGVGDQRTTAPIASDTEGSSDIGAAAGPFI